MIEEAEVRSIQTAVAELSERIASAGDGLRNTPADAVAADLYEVERYLRMAHRRLKIAADNLAAVND